MKTNSNTPWLRLAAAARKAPGEAFGSDVIDATACTPPLGFSARVVARAQVGVSVSYGALFERLAARALGVACACALAMATWGSLSTHAEAKSSDMGVDFYDPLGEVVLSTQS